LRPWAYLDQNVLAKSDDRDFARRVQSLAGEVVNYAISEWNYFEILKGPKAELYLKRLEAIKPWVMHWSEDGWTPPLPVGDFSGRLAEFAGLRFFFLSANFQSSLPTLLKFMGGDCGSSPEEIVARQDLALMSAIDALFEDLPESDRSIISQHFRREIQSASKDVLTLLKSDTFRQEAELFRRLREDLSRDGGLPNCPASELVARVLPHLPEREQACLGLEAPQDRSDRATRALISQLSWLLISLGALPKTQRIFSKGHVDALDLLTGHFLDVSHIVEAASCDIFITADKGAARCAAAVYHATDRKTKVLFWSKEVTGG
jgi:hypothetical protein